jgi:chromosome partitioning protein
MQVISIVQQKGGVGKTTLAINLAGELKQRGRRVIVIDADPQGSATAWAAPRKLGFEVKPEPVTNGTVSQWLRNVLKQNADVIIIDTPAGLGTVFRAAVDIADLVIIPCGPSSLDLNAARTTIANVTTALRNDPRSRARIVAVPTRVDTQTPEGQQIAIELAGLGESVAPSLSHDIYFVRAFTQGVHVGSAAPSSPAAQEIRATADFVIQALSTQQ